MPVLLTIIFCLWPVEYQLTKLGVVLGVIITWVGCLVLSWNKKWVRVALIFLALIPLVALCLPGRAENPELLSQDYVRGLRLFKGSRYVWGGEGLLGIDCSGLVRKGVILGQVWHGLKTFNGALIRRAAEIWWHDCSAMALRDSYRGWTRELCAAKSINSADLSGLKPGDLAVTADGVHVLAYLGHSNWIQADPGAHKVIEVSAPAENTWLKAPVVFVRWKFLE